MRKSVIVLFVLVAASLVSVAPVYAKPNTWATIGTHVVRRGETLYCIGRAYGVSPWAIAAHNGLATPNLIYVGRALAIPDAYASVPTGRVCARQFGGGGTACDCAKYHTVQAGQNLYRISRYYGVSMWRVARCNGIFNLNYIRVGQALCIPCS